MQAFSDLQLNSSDSLLITMFGREHSRENLKLPLINHQGAYRI
jgi:hypothetical protein